MNTRTIFTLLAAILMCSAADGLAAAPSRFIFEIHKIERGPVPQHVIDQYEPQISNLEKKMQNASEGLRKQLQRKLQLVKTQMDKRCPRIACGIGITQEQPNNSKDDPWDGVLVASREALSSGWKEGTFIEVTKGERRDDYPIILGIRPTLVYQYKKTRRPTWWPDTDKVPHPWIEPNPMLSHHIVVSNYVPPHTVGGGRSSVQSTLGSFSVGLPSWKEIKFDVTNEGEERIALLRGWLDFVDASGNSVWIFKRLVIIDPPQGKSVTYTLTLPRNIDYQDLESGSLSLIVRPSHIRTHSVADPAPSN